MITHGTITKKSRQIAFLLLFFCNLCFSQSIWSIVDSGYPDTTGELLSSIYANNQFVAVGWRILTSPDAQTWTIRSSFVPGNPLFSVVYGNNQFVTVGYSGIIYTSSDGASWTAKNSGTSHRLASIAFGNSTYIAVGDSGPGNGSLGIILSSSDGGTWTRRPTDAINNMLTSVTFGNNLFVAVGYQGLVITSTDGIAWTRRNSGTNSWLQAISYCNGQFIAVGSNGTIITSQNGSTWSSKSYSTPTYLYSVTYAAGQIVIGGTSGMILTSPDASVWTTRNSNVPTNNLMSACYGNNTFVITGDEGAILKSASDNPVAIYHSQIRTPIIANLKIGHVGNFVNIELPRSNTSNEFAARIFNISGRLTYSNTLCSKSGLLSIPSNHLSKGNYLVSIMNNGEQYLTVPFFFQ